MKKLLLIFITLFCTTHLYSATTITPSMCTSVEEGRCGINLEQNTSQLSCTDPSCTYCNGTETDENTTDHYQTTTQKQWTKVCDSVYYWCVCKTTVTYKCSDNYYGTVTGPNISGVAPTSIDCNACPQYATCNGGTTFMCKTGFTKNLGKCTCDGGFITGNGYNATCNKECPQYATCDGTTFKCNQGFTKNTLTNTCTCNGGFITGTGTNTICNACPQYAICNGGTNFDCKPGFIESGNTCICKGYIVNDQCYICPINATCKDGKITCNQNYYLDNDSCLACPYNGLTNGGGKTSKTECYIPKGRIIRLTNGTGEFTSKCNAQ